MTKKVLLVDDEAHVLRVMKMGLQRAGYEVLTARNGLEGLESFTKNEPNALVADIDMPIMNGVEMCSKIRSNFPNSPCKIFVSTSRAELEFRQWIRDVGNIQLLEKPISMRTLSAELEKHFLSLGDDKGDCA